MQTYFDGTVLDTTNYTYLADRIVKSENTYNSGTLYLNEFVTTYQHMANKTDSIVYIATGYNAQAGQNSKSVTYYHYDQNNQDTLEATYTISGQVATFFDSHKSYYTGSVLDSALSITANDLTRTYFENGIQMSNYFFDTNNHLIAYDNYTYSDIPTAGLNVYLTGGFDIVSYYSPKLRAGMTNHVLNGSGSFTETDSYTLDSVSRVSIIARKSDGPTNTKEICSYY
jgi:hypothetical protein